MSVAHANLPGTHWLATTLAGSKKMKIHAVGDYDVSEGGVRRAWLKSEGGGRKLLGQWPSEHGEHEAVMLDEVAPRWRGS